MKDAKSRIRPLGDKILIKELENTEKSKKTASGIIIPDTVHSDKGAKEGKVIAIGSGKYIDGKKVNLDVEVGDTVLFQWGDELTVDNQKYFIVSESSILAVIK